MVRSVLGWHMTDDVAFADLRLILRSTEKAASDARVARAAAERLAAGFATDTMPARRAWSHSNNAGSLA
jgi:hypothetical protein